MKDTIKNWAIAASVRVIKTFFQTLLVTLPVGMSIEQMGWLNAVGIAAGAGALSVITSLAGIPEVSDGASVAKIANNEDGGER